MKKTITILLIAMTLFALCSCGSPQSNPSAAVSSNEGKTEPAPTSQEEALPSSEPTPTPEAAGAAVSYESIYEEYAQKLRDTTPLLIEEYKMEAAGNDGGLEGLATLCNQKIESLAKISNDGAQEMAKYMMFHGSGKYEEYESWSTKLYDVYMEEAQKITDTYMDSVT